jgi:hypothetical protein
MLLKIVSDVKKAQSISQFKLPSSAAVFGAGKDSTLTHAIVNAFAVFF